MTTLHPSSLYSPSDWAELFVLCTEAKESGDDSRVYEWLSEYSRAHDLPQPEVTEKWSDTEFVIKEALMFLDKFAENHTDDFENRKEEQIEQTRRDEKNGLYPDRWDDCN